MIKLYFVGYARSDFANCFMETGKGNSVVQMIQIEVKVQFNNVATWSTAWLKWNTGSQKDEVCFFYIPGMDTNVQRVVNENL